MKRHFSMSLVVGHCLEQILFMCHPENLFDRGNTFKDFLDAILTKGDHSFFHSHFFNGIRV